MIKVAMIGAGSVVFSKNLTGDILSHPEFQNATIAYMDVDIDRLRVGAALCRKVAKALGATPTIIETLDRREALQGADFVINMVQIGGFNSTLVDFEIPRKYGLRFTIADTTGPGGLFRAFRTYPMLTGLCRDMEEICPNAILLNYSNPMSMNMQTITRTSGVRAVGLCHSVQGTFNQLMGYLNEDPADIAFRCAGINHMAFFLEMTKNGVDQYPRLFQAMSDPEIYTTNKVRFELMKRLGYYVTESSEHNAEYNPYFIPRGQSVIDRFDVPLDEYLRRCDGIVDEFERMKSFSVSDTPIDVHRSHEYGSTIIHSVVTGTPSVVYGNMPNRGAISSLPYNAIAEAPTLVDRNGLQFVTVGELPMQLTAYMTPHIAQQELFIQAAMTGRRDHVYQAAMFDPLTAATMSLDSIVEMCDELIAAHGALLPRLDTVTLVPTSGKTFGVVDPADLRRSWDEAQSPSRAEPVRDWHVIGPFESTDDAGEKYSTPADKFAAGKVDLANVWNVNGHTLRWRKAEMSPAGTVAIGDERGQCGDAYGYAEIESVHARETVLRVGGSERLVAWLNGELVCEVGEGDHPSNVPVFLQSGVNRLLVKVDRAGDGSEFVVEVAKANF